MQIDVEFIWTFQEYRRLQFSVREAMKTYPRRKTSALIGSPLVERRLFLTGMGVVSAVAFFCVIGLLGGTLIGLAVGMLMLLPFAWAFAAGGQSALRLRDAWLNNPNIEQPQRYVLSDETLIYNTVGTRMEVQWSAITHAHEDRFFFLFFRSPQSVLSIPKRSLKLPEETNVLRALCEGINSRTDGFPVKA